MTSSVAEKNASIYNLLVIINKLSHVLSLLIDSGEPEDIVDEGNILNIYHSNEQIMCKWYVFWITSICFYYYYYYYYYLFLYISFRVCLKWSRQSRREKINFTQLSSFVRPVVYRPLNWLKIYHIANRTQCLTFSMYLQVQAVCKYLKSFTWTVYASIYLVFYNCKGWKVSFILCIWIFLCIFYELSTPRISENIYVYIYFLFT